MKKSSTITLIFLCIASLSSCGSFKSSNTTDNGKITAIDDSESDQNYNETKNHVHTYGNWVTTSEAKPGVEGSKYRECTVCGYKETTAIPALPVDSIVTAKINNLYFNSYKYEDTYKYCYVGEEFNLTFRFTLDETNFSGVKYENIRKESYEIVGENLDCIKLRNVEENMYRSENVLKIIRPGKVKLKLRSKSGKESNTLTIYCINIKLPDMPFRAGHTTELSSAGWVYGTNDVYATFNDGRMLLRNGQNNISNRKPSDIYVNFEFNVTNIIYKPYTIAYSPCLEFSLYSSNDLLVETKYAYFKSDEDFSVKGYVARKFRFDLGSNIDRFEYGDWYLTIK